MTKRKLRIIFMGSPDFAVPSLQALIEHHQVLAVVTQPDRRRGRGQTLTPPPVKVVAEAAGVPVLQPEKLRRREVREKISSYGAEVFIVAAYGKILSPKMLAVPPMGCINVHASLLPKYRGAAPIHWAVICGEQQSGITIMQMDAGMDTGPMYAQAAIDIAPEETAGTLHDRLAPLGAKLLVETLESIVEEDLKPHPQPEEGVTMAPMLCKEDGCIDFKRPAKEVDCRIRGLDPWPGAHTFIDDCQLKLFKSKYISGIQGRPGEVLGADCRGLLVACSQDAVCIRDLQLPGRRCLFTLDLLSGRPIPPGTILGRPLDQ